MAKNIVFLGPQGAGKGTIADRIQEKYGFPHISTGEMFRNAYEQGTELGIMAKEKYWGKGILVPDNITVNLVKERISNPDCSDGFMLDGFPRNIPQAEALSKLVNINYVIFLNIPEELSIKRLSFRRQCRECGAIYNIHPDLQPHPKKEGICDKCGTILYQRDDDREDAIKKRLEIYHKETKPLIDFYGEKVRQIDASQELGKIVEDVEKALDLIK